jgi:hypothetical protein
MQGASLHRSYRFREVKNVLRTKTVFRRTKDCHSRVAANPMTMPTTAPATTEAVRPLSDDSSGANEILDEALRRDAEIESGLVREQSHEEFIAGLRLPKVA